MLEIIKILLRLLNIKHHILNNCKQTLHLDSEILSLRGNNRLPRKQDANKKWNALIIKPQMACSQFMH